MASYLVVLTDFFPLFGLFFLIFTKNKEENKLRQYAMIGTVPSLIFALIIYQLHMAGLSWSAFSLKKDFLRFGNLEKYDANLYTVAFELGVDGLSLMLVLLTVSLATIAVAVPIADGQSPKRYFQIILLVETTVLGALTAQNLFLFLVFLECSIVVMFFFISQLNAFDSEKKAKYFFAYNSAGFGLLFFVCMVLFARTGTVHIETIKHMMTLGGEAWMAPITETMKMGLFLVSMLGFCLLLGVFPFHRWVIRMVAYGPSSIVVLQVVLMWMMSGYGMIRISFGMFPEQFQQIAFYVALLGVITFLYGVLRARKQQEMKRLLSYVFVSQTGVLLMGLGSVTEDGVEGAIFQLFSHSSLFLLFYLLVEVLTQKAEVNLFGLRHTSPAISIVLCIAALALAGMPGTSGFISLYYIVSGLYKAYPVLFAFSLLGWVMTAIYVIKSIILPILKQKKGQNDKRLDDRRNIDYVPLFIIVFLIICIGVYPAILSEQIVQTIELLIDHTGTGGIIGVF